MKTAPADEAPFQLPPAPRHVRLKPLARDRVWLTRLFTLPFIAAGCFAIFSLLESPLVSIFGRDATGQIVDVHPYWRGADGRRFDVAFTYSVGSGISATDYGQVDTGGGSPPVLHQSIPIRVVSIGTFHRSQLRDSPSGTTGFVCAGLFIGVWCTGVAIFTLYAWLAPVVQMRLIRDGNATSGVIIAKHERRSGRTASRVISYKFPIAHDEVRHGTMNVSVDAFQRLEVGQSVVVIYNASSPLRSVLYTEADYESVVAGL